MFEYQRHGQYFAQTPQSLEAAAAEELAALGAEDCRPVYRGVRFKASPRVLCRVNYRARLVGHVIAPLLTFDCHSDRYLHRTALTKIDWSLLLDPDTSFAVAANVAQSRLSHSQYAAQRLKDAICDFFRDRTGRRPDVDRREPDLLLSLNVTRNRAVIGVDTSGGSLHRRGYRTATVEAPLQETAAAAVIRFGGWTGDTPLLDPMCGSGTLLAEALMAGARLPEGMLRVRWGLKRLPDFDAALWAEEKAAADALRRDLPRDRISGGDLDPAAVAAARENLGRLPGGAAVRLKARDFRDHPGLEGGAIVCNPPYGVRLGKRAAVEKLYGDLGDFLKRRCAGSRAWILCGDTHLVGCLGLRPKRRTTLWNGPLECRLVELEIY